MIPLSNERMRIQKEEVTCPHHMVVRFGTEIKIQLYLIPGHLESFIHSCHKYVLSEHLLYD